MRLIDTHSHLYDEVFDADRNDALQRAIDNGVDLQLVPAVDSERHAVLFDLCRNNPEHCLPMIGLHPTSVNDNPQWREELALVERLLETPPHGVTFCGVGEIGLDFYWSQEFIAEQEEAFRRQCRAATRLGLPVAIHTRNAWERMCEVIEEEVAAARARGEELRGVFHAFSEGVETYRRLRAAGDFLFGIGGVATYKKSLVGEAVRDMDLEDLVLETDCPYLTPVPYRGKRNEPAYLTYVCEKIAELQGRTAEEVAEVTTRNALRMFSPNHA